MVPPSSFRPYVVPDRRVGTLRCDALKGYRWKCLGLRDGWFGEVFDSERVLWDGMCHVTMELSHYRHAECASAQPDEDQVVLCV